MRKTLSEDFNRHSNYGKLKATNKDPNLLISLLTSYSEQILSKADTKTTVAVKDLVFFLGAYL